MHPHSHPHSQPIFPTYFCIHCSCSILTPPLSFSLSPPNSLYILFLFFTVGVASTALFIAFGRDSVHYVFLHSGFQYLLRMSFAEEYNNIEVIGNRPIVSLYSILYLLVVIILLNIFLAIVSNRYLKALEASQKNWEQLVTTRMEQDRVKKNKTSRQSLNRRRPFQQKRSPATHAQQTPIFRGNLWTSAMQNVLIQTRVLGKDRIAIPNKAKRRPAKKFRVLGHAIVFDASTVHRDAAGNGDREGRTSLDCSKNEKTLRQQTTMLDENDASMGKMGTEIHELATILKVLHKLKGGA